MEEKELEGKRKNRFLLWIILAITVSGALGTYALWPVIFPSPPPLPPKPKLSNIIVRALDQNNKTLGANVTITSGGVTVGTGKTPLNLTLQYGTYAFTIVYQHLTIEKTIEINQPTKEITGNFETPKVLVIEVRAIDQDSNPITAEVEVTKSTTGALVIMGETPLNVTLEPRTYNFTFKYRDLLVKKTIEITQATREVVATFEIPQEPVVLEITSDELLTKIYTVSKGEKEGKNVTELKNWLLSLVNQTIRVKSKFTSTSYSYAGKTELGYYKFIEHTAFEIIFKTDTTLIKETWNFDQEFIIEGKVEKIVFQSKPQSDTFVWMTVEKVVEAH